MAFSVKIARLRPVLSMMVAWLLAFQCIQKPGVAQESTLEVAIIQGDNLQNDLDTLRTWEIAVRVQDRQGNKVKGVPVFFQVPQGFGTFLNGTTSITVMTDDDGVARVRGFRKGKAVGAFFITASATYQGMKGSARINQVNTGSAVMSTPHKILVIGSVVATGIVAAVFAARKTDSQTTVTLGNGSVNRQ